MHVSLSATMPRVRARAVTSFPNCVSAVTCAKLQLQKHYSWELCGLPITDSIHENGRYRTDTSYAVAGRMLMAAGTPAFTECSIQLYPSVAKTIVGQQLT